jgi:hypothetical protein
MHLCQMFIVNYDKAIKLENMLKSHQYSACKNVHLTIYIIKRP